MVVSNHISVVYHMASDIMLPVIIGVTIASIAIFIDRIFLLKLAILDAG